MLKSKTVLLLLAASRENLVSSCKDLQKPEEELQLLEDEGVDSTAVSPNGTEAAPVVNEAVVDDKPAEKDTQDTPITSVEIKSHIEEKGGKLEELA